MAPKDEHTTPSRATRLEEEREAQAEHGASDASTSGKTADPPTEVDDDVSEHYRDMAERGANSRGEGRLP